MTGKRTPCGRLRRLRAAAVFAALAALAALPATAAAADGRPVAVYGVFEAVFETDARTANPYREVAAEAVLTAPDGGRRRVPLFWDGGRRFRLRFSPDLPGRWGYRLASGDAGLDGRTGAFEARHAGLKGGIRRNARHGRHFEHQDGSPFFFMGDTQWSLFADSRELHHGRSEVLRYIDRRADQGFTVVTAQLMHGFGWDNAGGPPFFDFRSERINPAYWREVDRRLLHLNARGLTGGLLLAWAASDGGYDYRRFGGIEAALRYARYVVARYSAFNVYFVVAGEYDELDYDWDRVGRTVAAADPHGRLVGVHGTGSTAEFAGRPWCGFGDYQQLYENLYANVLRARRSGKPVVNAEYGYFLRDKDADGRVDKPNSRTVGEIRDASWEIAMAGGYFITGFGSTYFGGFRHPGPFAPRQAHNLPWERQVAALKRIFTRTAWWRLAPANGLASSGGDRPLVLAEPGRQYLVYFDRQRMPFRLLVPELRGKPVHVRRIDPRSGGGTALEAALRGDHLEIGGADGGPRVYLIETDE